MCRDPRSPVAPIRTHTSTHSDDITALHFLRPSSSSSTSSPAPSHPRTLLSASSDGLISVSNADEEDEDEAVIQVSNWGCSISQVGWFHQNRGPSRYVWAASDMETFSTWTHEVHSGCISWVFPGLMLWGAVGPKTEPRYSQPFGPYGSKYLGNRLSRWLPHVRYQRIGRLRRIERVCSCAYSPSHGLAILTDFCARFRGDIALIRNADYEDREASWTLERVWSTGHSGVVRSMLWDERVRCPPSLFSSHYLMPK